MVFFYSHMRVFFLDYKIMYKNRDKDTHMEESSELGKGGEKADIVQGGLEEAMNITKYTIKEGNNLHDCCNDYKITTIYANLSVSYTQYMLKII